MGLASPSPAGPFSTSTAFDARRRSDLWHRFARSRSLTGPARPVSVRDLRAPAAGRPVLEPSPACLPGRALSLSQRCRELCRQPTVPARPSSEPPGGAGSSAGSVPFRRRRSPGFPAGAEASVSLSQRSRELCRQPTVPARPSSHPPSGAGSSAGKLSRLPKAARARLTSWACGSCRAPAAGASAGGACPTCPRRSALSLWTTAGKLSGSGLPLQKLCLSLATSLATGPRSSNMHYLYIGSEGQNGCQEHFGV